MQKLLEQMNLDTYQILRTALEIGKWENGEKLTNEQKQNTMELILLFEHAHNLAQEQRVGFIQDECESTSKNAETQIIKLEN